MRHCSNDTAQGDGHEIARVNEALTISRVSWPRESQPEQLLRDLSNGEGSLKLSFVE